MQPKGKCQVSTRTISPQKAYLDRPKRISECFEEFFESYRGIPVSPMVSIHLEQVDLDLWI